MTNRCYVCALYTSNNKTHSTSEVRIDALTAFGIQNLKLENSHAGCRTFMQVRKYNGLFRAHGGATYLQEEERFIRRTLIMARLPDGFYPCVTVTGKTYCSKVHQLSEIRTRCAETIPRLFRFPPLKGTALCLRSKLGSIIAPEMYLASSGPLARTL